jgi:type IV fimbrial biogenesis protein FimT
MINTVGKQQKAFTLMELLVTIAIVSILASVALPVYTSFVSTTKISSYASQLHAALLLTRSEAIKRGRSVTICRSSDADTASPHCAAAISDSLTNTGWGEGWLVYVDINNDNIYGSDDVLIRVQGTMISSVAAGAITPFPNRNRLTYNSTGQIFGTFMRFVISRPISDVEASHDRLICIASGGRARVATTSCS